MSNPGNWTKKIRLTRTFVWNAEAPNPEDPEGPLGAFEEGPAKEEIVEEVETKPGYKISWPDLTSTSDAERAAILAQRTTAWAEYIASGMSQYVAPIDYCVNFDTIEEGQARQMLETAEEEAQAEADNNMAQGLNPDGSDPNAPVQGIDPETGEPMVDEEGNPLDQNGNPLPHVVGPPGIPSSTGGPPKPPGTGSPPPQVRPGQPPRAGTVPPRGALPPRPGAPKTQPKGSRPVPPQFRK